MNKLKLKFWLAAKIQNHFRTEDTQLDLRGDSASSNPSGLTCRAPGLGKPRCIKSSMGLTQVPCWSNWITFLTFYHGNNYWRSTEATCITATWTNWRFL